MVRNSAGVAKKNGKSSLEYLTGFECTHIFGSGIDVIANTEHDSRYDADLRLVRDSGIQRVRYPAPWHRIEKVKGTYCWDFTDKTLAAFEKYGLTPIIDPLHHTSFPEWLSDGFANKEFPARYAQFVAAFAQRYPNVKEYTVFNEPFVTTFFSGFAGIWYPFFRGDEQYVPLLLNSAKATVLATTAIAEITADAKFIHVDSCEKHHAASEQAQQYVDFRNDLRFLFIDLIQGKVNHNHPLYTYVRKNGAKVRDLNWLEQHPARIDVIGLDYYAHSEVEWIAADKSRAPIAPAEGFATIAKEYITRFGKPIMLSETNIRGFVTDRILWLKFMSEQCEQLNAYCQKSNIAFEGFCWYPFVDSTDWGELCTKNTGLIDPVGIYWLSPDKTRHASDFSRLYRDLAMGKIQSKDLPAYRARSPVAEQLSSFQHLMSGWKWQKPITT